MFAPSPAWYNYGLCSIKWHRKKRCVFRTSTPERTSASCRNASFFEFSLCLSRACLGKMIIFISRWRKKWRFFPYHGRCLDLLGIVVVPAGVGPAEILQRVNA
eukprot:COSAG03_NODE_13918_length_484_cov_0.664935_2_plen_102_part_01